MAMTAAPSTPPSASPSTMPNTLGSRTSSMTRTPAFGIWPNGDMAAAAPGSLPSLLTWATSSPNLLSWRPSFAIGSSTFHILPPPLHPSPFPPSPPDHSSPSPLMNFPQLSVPLQMDRLRAPLASLTGSSNGVLPLALPISSPSSAAPSNSVITPGQSPKSSLSPNLINRTMRPPKLTAPFPSSSALANSWRKLSPTAYPLMPYITISSHPCSSLEPATWHPTLPVSSATKFRNHAMWAWWALFSS